MAQFFFDLHECGHNAIIDTAGVVLADIAAAREHAITAARQVMAGEVIAGRLCLGCAVVIRNADNHEVLAVPFADALAVTFVAPNEH